MEERVVTSKNWVGVSVEPTLNQKLIDVSQQFIDKANELEENYLEIYENFPLLQGAFETTIKLYCNEDDLKDIDNAVYKVGGGHNIPLSRHRIKGLYLDFRLFFANDEIINFNKFINNLGQFSTDTSFRNFLNEQKTLWNRTSLASDGCGYSEKDIIRYYFNSHFFHLPDKKIKPHYEKIKFIYDDMTLEWIVFDFVIKRCIQIFNVKNAISEIHKSVLMVPKRFT